MINLRYHIVSLTAVFLAIGIGLTLGSTFLDRATVDNLNGQLESLETRLDARETRIDELEGELENDQAERDALDAQGTVLLSGRLTSTPVLVITSAGADDEDLDATLSALAASGADLQGVLTFTERFALDDDGAIADLGAVVDLDSSDPSRLRRSAINLLGAELRSRQDLGLADPEVEEPTGEPAEEPTEDPTAGESTDAPTDAPTDADESPAPIAGDEVPASVELIDALVADGFLTFESVPGGPDAVAVPAGVRLVIVGGSSDVPDDVVLEPLVERLARGADAAILGVVTSALPGDGEVSDAVSVIRQDEALRALVPTVDSVEQFVGRAALVLALDDVGEGLVGHYGLAEGATQLLPPARIP